jgi:hypothetical protein
MNATPMNRGDKHPPRAEVEMPESFARDAGRPDRTHLLKKTLE